MLTVAVGIFNLDTSAVRRLEGVPRTFFQGISDTFSVQSLGAVFRNAQDGPEGTPLSTMFAGIPCSVPNLYTPNNGIVSYTEFNPVLAEIFSFE